MSALIVPYEPWHMQALDGRAMEDRAVAALGGGERVSALCDLGTYAWTGIDDGVPFACIGVTVLWKGVGSAWAFLSPAAFRHFLTVHRGVEMFLRGAFSDDEFHRIETFVRMDHAAGHRWAIRLGFTAEGIKRQYGYDRADYMGYARTSPWQRQ